MQNALSFGNQIWFQIVVGSIATLNIHGGDIVRQFFMEITFLATGD